MPTNAEPEALVDTSVAIAYLRQDHDAHERVSDALRGRLVGLAGHAAFETYSVLTRVAPPERLTPADARAAIEASFPATRHLGEEAASALVADLVAGAIAGGAVYDALVGAAAREHGVTLVTRDLRAVGTYRVLGVDFELVR